jgi:hypothetical protein
MKRLSKFPSVDEKGTGKDVLKKISAMRETPHIVVVKGYDDDYILGFVGEDDLKSSLKFCQLNPTNC